MLQGRGAECHVTGYAKNYDARSRTYSSVQSEIGVGCEACHGPGEAHVAWAKAPDPYDESRFTGIGPNSPLKKASLTGFHATAKHIAAKAVSPFSETMRTI